MCLLQVTVEYRLEEGACVPIRVHTIVISVQHDEDVSLQEMRKQLKEAVCKVWMCVCVCVCVCVCASRICVCVCVGVCVWVCLCDTSICVWYVCV